MARKGIIHRDLKPENILLSSKVKGVYDVRIADFGFAVQLAPAGAPQDPLLSITCGTAGYIPPEALSGKPFNLKSDIFSLGSLLFSILTRRNLFDGKTYSEVIVQNSKCDYPRLQSDLKKFSADTRDIISKMLSQDPGKRPNAI
jgi:eukaryotic-like serine/threonine-protein kinase